MPRFTIDLSQKAANRLQVVAQRTNENEGVQLTLQQWLALHLKEMAIAEELAAVSDQLRRQHETEARDALGAAIRAARDELLAGLDEGSEP